MKKITRVAIYARLSDDRSGEEANVKDQVSALEAKAVLEGWEVFDVYSDNNRPASDPARKPRPEFLRLLEDAREGMFDAILIRYVDRLYRHPADLDVLVKACDQHSIVVVQEKAGHPLQLDTPNGMFTARILAAVGMLELEQKAVRQKDQTNRLLKSGAPRANVNAFGFNPNMTPHPVEAELVKEAYKRVLAKESLGSIIKDWNDRGIKTRRPNGKNKGAWGYTSFRTLLLRPSNAGIRQATVDGEVVESGKATWEGLVPEAMFRTVQEILTSADRVKHKGMVAKKHVLSHIMKCSRCSSPMRSGSTTTRAGKVAKVYQCPASGCRMAVDYDVAEDVVLGMVTLLLVRQHAALKRFIAGPAKSISEKSDRVRALELEVEQILANADVSLDDQLTLVGVRRKEQEQLRRQIAQSADRYTLASLITELREGMPNVPLAEKQQIALVRFNRLELNQRKQIINTLVSVEVMPHNKSLRPTKETARARVKVKPRTDLVAPA